MLGYATTAALSTRAEPVEAKAGHAAETDYRALYCRLASKDVKDLTVEEQQLQLSTKHYLQVQQLITLG